MKAICIKTMKHVMLLLSFLLLANAGLFSQRTIDISYHQDAKGAYVFSGDNHAFCSYILEIGFTRFDNLKSDHPLPYLAEIKPGMNPLFSLMPVNPNDPVKFNYSSHFYKGCLQPKPDTGFTYLLPIGPGKEAQAYEMNNPSGGTAQQNVYVIRLRMKPGDTIYAARKGVVTDVEDQDVSNDAGAVSAGHENNVEIIHADCSFGHYGILRKNSALVKPGQMVKAGQPIGLVGGDAYGRGSEARFSVYYNQEEQGPQNAEDLKISIAYVRLQFWTKNNGKSMLKHGAVYTSEFPLAVLNQEIKKTNPKQANPKRKK
jgi:hypothetical protein